MKVLVWHVYGSWMTSFVQGGHDYLVPVLPDRGPDGRGRAHTWDWPPKVREITPEELAEAEVDVVVLQRPHEVALAERWLGGRRPGREIPAVYVEHNCPQGPVNGMLHPVASAGWAGIGLVHVTHFNQLFWDSAEVPTWVVPHGVPDPGWCYSGERARAAVVVNEPLSRRRVTGTDLLAPLSVAAPLDVFGIGADRAVAVLGAGGKTPLTAYEDLPQHRLHQELAERRVYLHPYRWTSLGLSLIEAMLLGMPVVALATTEVVEAVPSGAGVLSNDLARLADGLRTLIADRDAAEAAGRVGRAAALAQFGLDRFCDDWDQVLKQVCA
jgi:hypothetical protein